MIRLVVEWLCALIGVFSWGEKGLKIDNEKCISCGKCEEACMVSAIKVAKDEQEYQKIKKEIEEDPRTINDLLIDRYGAKPIDIAMMGKESEIEKKMEAQRPMIIELYNEDSIMCLLKSIPIKEIADAFDKETRYRKIEIEKQETLEKYQVKELPALLFFRNGKMIKKYEGYVEEEEKNKLLNFIKE
ncbi:MAG: 4Fe-4S binding protein [Clostridia bacterium]|nr:4Fe-4S binding protein [Clostridia bacterium]